MHSADWLVLSVYLIATVGIVVVIHFLSKPNQIVDTGVLNEEANSEHSHADSSGEPVADPLPLRIVGGSLAALGLGMLALVPINVGQRLSITIFAAVLMLLGGGILRLSRKLSR